MPGMSGPALQDALDRRGDRIPIVFITAHRGDATDLLRRGAAACLPKPFADTELLAALNGALRRG